MLCWVLAHPATAAEQRPSAMILDAEGNLIDSSGQVIQGGKSSGPITSLMVNQVIRSPCRLRTLPLPRRR